MDDPIALLNLIASTGVNIFIAYLVVDMRKQQRVSDERTWLLFEYLVKEKGLDADAAIEVLSNSA